MTRPFRFDVAGLGEVMLRLSVPAGERLRPLVAEADLLFCKSADAAALLGCAGEPRAQLEALAKLTRAKTIFLTLGERGAALLDQGEYVERPALPVQIVDRIGGGDAFAAGALDGFLDGDLRAGLERGVAMAAIALSRSTATACSLRARSWRRCWRSRNGTSHAESTTVQSQEVLRPTLDPIPCRQRTPSSRRAVATMSSTLAPRERSDSGLAKPCRTGPMAWAPARVWVSL